MFEQIRKYLDRAEAKADAGDMGDSLFEMRKAFRELCTILESEHHYKKAA